VEALRLRAVRALYLAAAIAFVLDRITKVAAERALPGDPVSVIPGVLSFRFATNSGGAFSLFQDIPWFFATVSILVSLGIVATSARHDDRVVAAALGLILGGALGNLTDRIVRGPGFSGQVVDFIDLHVWPVFNLADSAIVIGALVLAWRSSRRRPVPARQDQGGG
jgi:signal peptidase II